MCALRVILWNEKKLERVNTVRKFSRSLVYWMTHIINWSILSDVVETGSLTIDNGNN